MDVPEVDRRMWLWRKLFVLSTFWLTSALIILQILDWATTSWLLMTLNDTSLEANPAMRWVIELPNGMLWFAALKLGFCGVLAYIVPYSAQHSASFVWIWRVLALLYVVIVASNLLGVATVCILL